MRLEDYLRVLRRQWFVVAVMALLGLTVSAGASVLQPARYSATAESFLTAGSGATVSDLSQGTTFSQEAVKGYARIATTEYILGPVVKELRLGVSASVLAERVTAVADSDTSVIEVTATDSSATRAASIANAVTDRLAAAVPALTVGTGVSDPVKITRVQSAAVSAASTSPDVPIVLAVGLLTGLVLGAGAALVRESLDTRVRSAAEVELHAGTALLGTVLRDSEAGTRPIVVDADDRSAQAEAYRTLRTNLRFVRLDPGSRSFVLTSSVQGEGKSTTTANLALSISLIEERVVIVDADLRRPQLHDLFDVDNSVGLVDVLIGAASLDSALQSWGANGLFVLPAGAAPPNPSELLQSGAMRELVKDLQQRFTTVLFDAPPLLPVADAAIVAKETDGAVVVAALRQVRRAQLSQTSQILRRADVRVLGAVVTMVPQRTADVYSYASAAD